MALRGNFRILILYDVAEVLDLEKLRQAMGAKPEPAKPAFARRTPEYVRLEQPPLVETVQGLELPAGFLLPCTLKYYSFAVVSVQLTVPFDCGWDELLRQTSRWMDTADTEPAARAFVFERLERLMPGTARHIDRWLEEDYLVIELAEIEEPGESHATAADLVSWHKSEIVQLVRGETQAMARKAVEETLQNSISYYQCDLVVVSSSGALVYDRPEEAAATAIILEYAKMQLLEFRYYDNLMTRLLTRVYDTLERKQNILLSRWTIPREATRVNRIRMDTMELTERVDNAIKFVSDAHYARVYRLAENSMGVREYRELVDEKLRTVGELYGFMTDQFNQAREFVLELAIAVLCMLDVLLIFLFRAS
jgi:hypothetical protein